MITFHQLCDPQSLLIPPLHEAAKKGDVDRIRYLVGNGTDPDSRHDTYGKWGEYTPLHYAVEYNQILSIHTLLELGADVEPADSADGRSPLHTAAKMNYVDIMRILITAGADVDITDTDGRTALFLAVQNNNLEAVKLLIESGVDANIVDEFYNTALHYCNRSLKCAMILLNGGADMFKKNEDEKLAFDDPQLWDDVYNAKILKCPIKID